MRPLFGLSSRHEDGRAPLCPPLDASAEESQANSSDVLSGIPLRMLGFGILMGWHFLILYFPELSLDSSLSTSDRLIGQIALNGSLCLSFALFGFLMSRNHEWLSRNLRSACFAGVALAVVGCLGFTLTDVSFTPVLYQCSIGVMGVCEGFFMLLWFRFYAVTTTNYTVSYLAASAVVGGLICYFTRHLTSVLPTVVFVALPIISMLLFLPAVKTTSYRYTSLHGMGKTNWADASSPFYRATIQLIAFSFCFGILQGAATVGNAVNFPVESPASSLGFAIAGIVLYMVYLRYPDRQDLTPAHVISVVLFLAAITYIPYSSGEVSTLLSVLTMAGFTLFDLAILALLLNLVRAFDLEPELVLGSNRAAEYGAFVLGIAASVLIENVFGDYPMLPNILACTSALACCITVMVLFVDNDSIWTQVKARRQIFDAPENEDVPPLQGKWKAACNQICDEYELSPRERDVFMLIAKGRNAEYVQNALYISGHTAKTHISNIYKKLNIHSVQELLDIVEEARGRGN